MTDIQILELAKSFGVYDNGSWEFWEELLLKFARAMYDKGYDSGTLDGEQQ